MARKVRVQYPGAIYHAMNRGDHKEAIFSDDDDRLLFLSTLDQACRKTAWQIHSFCLMSNHFHLVIETPNANLVEGMKWFLGVYTARFNRRRKLFGHLFSGRYKAIPVDGSGNGYLKAVCDYVHLNPVRAGLLRAEQPLQAYRWSSYPLYLGDGASRPAWLRVDRLLGEWGIRWEQPGAGRQFAAVMEARRRAELEQQFKPVPPDWCIGSEQFRKEMLEYVEQQRGKWHYGQELCEAAQAKAERLIQTALRSEGLTHDQLAKWRKGHPFKIRLAAKLRAETTVTVSWIAERLSMGSRGHLAHLLFIHERTHIEPSSSNQLGLPI
jgi:REP element-mobilizing transposase RayT